MNFFNKKHTYIGYAIVGVDDCMYCEKKIIKQRPVIDYNTGKPKRVNRAIVHEPYDDVTISKPFDIPEHEYRFQNMASMGVMLMDEVEFASRGYTIPKVLTGEGNYSYMKTYIYNKSKNKVVVSDKRMNKKVTVYDSRFTSLMSVIQDIESLPYPTTVFVSGDNGFIRTLADQQVFNLFLLTSVNEYSEHKPIDFLDDVIFRGKKITKEQNSSMLLGDKINTISSEDDDVEAVEVGGVNSNITLIRTDLIKKQQSKSSNISYKFVEYRMKL